MAAGHAATVEDGCSKIGGAVFLSLEFCTVKKLKKRGNTHEPRRVHAMASSSTNHRRRRTPLRC